MIQGLRRGAGRAAATAAALLLSAAGPAAAPVAHPAAPVVPESITAAARTIQNVCFSLYPPDLLATMTGTPAPPPQEVRDDPARQMKYLSAEKHAAQGLFYPSSLDDILPGLMTEVRPGRSLLDLGSGDGRVAFIAAILGAQATGIEYDPQMHAIARAALKELKATVPKERVTLLKGDFYRLDWSRYDVLFYFGSGTFDEPRMLAKLRKEMRSDAVLVLAHVPEAPEGFLLRGRYGVVGTWQRDPQDLPESDAVTPPGAVAPSRPGLR